jgi:hypothetical protein
MSLFKLPSPRAFAALLTRTARLASIAGLVAFSALPAHATDEYEYGADEYVTVSKGLSPDSKYAITGHGGAYYSKDCFFHVYLTDAVTGKKIGPLEEIDGNLDTGAGSFAAKWSKESDKVTIVFRISRQEPLRAYTYHIAKRRASLVKGPFDASESLATYWSQQCSDDHPSEKTFGKPKAK